MFACPPWIGSGLQGLYHSNGRHESKADTEQVFSAAKKPELNCDLEVPRSFYINANQLAVDLLSATPTM